jgi:hypothetical protein
MHNDAKLATEQHVDGEAAGDITSPARGLVDTVVGPALPMTRAVFLLGCLVLAAGCGEVGLGAPAPISPTVRQVLLEPPEQVETLPANLRQDLYRSLLKASAGGPSDGLLALFPVVQNGTLAAAPPLELRLDLLEAPDGGEPLVVNLDSTMGDRWPVDRREALQGLSEREAAELVARTLASRWSLHPRAALRVERAASVPYAAAYADGVLRLNPAILYLAAASPEVR